jgi:hypothetical protein
LKMDAGLEHLHAVAHPPPLTPPEKGAGKAWLFVKKERRDQYL